MLVIGHRGAAALAPENTLAAIDAALAHGVDAVELDVVRRGDGGLVLAHPPLLPPDAPTLDEALAHVASSDAAVQLDVKDAGMEEEIAAAVERHGLAGRAFVSSVSAAALHAFATAAPDLPRSFSYPDDRLNLSARRLVRPAIRPGLAALRRTLPRRLPPRLRAVGASAATLNVGVVTPAVVAACHAAGAAVYVWTVNDPAWVKPLVEAGIDGIITDDPRILRPFVATP